MFTSLFMKTLLYLSLTCLIVEPKFGHEFGLFFKQKNIYKYFPKTKMNSSSTILFIYSLNKKKKKNYEIFVYLD